MASIIVLRQEDAMNVTPRKFCGGPNCGKLALHQCGRCSSVHYCSKPCQKNDWSRHKSACHRINDLGGVAIHSVKEEKRVVELAQEACTLFGGVWNREVETRYNSVINHSSAAQKRRHPSISLLDFSKRTAGSSRERAMLFKAFIDQERFLRKDLFPGEATLQRVFAKDGTLGVRTWNTFTPDGSMHFVVDLWRSPGNLYVQGSVSAKRYINELPWARDDYALVMTAEPLGSFTCGTAIVADGHKILPLKDGTFTPQRCDTVFFGERKS